MWFKSLNILATALLATVSYADVLPMLAPPEPQAAPQEPAPKTKVRHLRVYGPNAGSSYLGVEPRDVTPERVSALKLNESRGVEVMMVDRDSPGGKAGLREHDVILGLNGKPVANADQLRALLRATTPGTTVPLAINRGGQSMKLNVELGKRPEMMAMVPPIPMPPLDIDVPSMVVLQRSSRNGVLVEDISPQLADFFGVKNGGGVLVRSVDRGSAGDAAGLKAGDVIVKVANQPITCSSDWRRLMHGQQGNVQLGVIRDKREQGLTIKLPEKGPESSFQFNSDEFRKEMDGLRAELDRQRPELQKQMQLAQSDLRKSLSEHHKEFDQMMQKLRSEDFRHDLENMQQALQQELKDLQKE